MPFWEMVLKLVVAILLGSLIGLERETHGRPAGLRTHVLVCMGSTLFTIASYVIAGPQRAVGPINDPGRLAAQIVTGIGFLGAGTIIHQGSVVRGLTTAASIWAVAAIGIAIGIGGQMMYLAGVAALLVVGTLYLMGRIDKYLLAPHGERFLTITMKRAAEHLCDVLSIVSKCNARIRSIDSRESEDPAIHILRVRLRVDRDFDEAGMSSELASNIDVLSYIWE